MDIFDSLSTQDQFLLILHELIYRDFIRTGITQDSRNVRFLTTYLSSQEFFNLAQDSDSKSIEQYSKVLEEQRLLKPWLNPIFTNYVLHLYASVLQRKPEAKEAVNYWAKKCHKVGIRYLLTEFLTAREAIKKNLSPQQSLITIKKVLGLKKVPPSVENQWLSIFKQNRQEAQRYILKDLIPNDISCFNFIKNHPKFKISHEKGL